VARKASARTCAKDGDPTNQESTVTRAA